MNISHKHTSHQFTQAISHLIDFAHVRLRYKYLHKFIPLFFCGAREVGKGLSIGSRDGICATRLVGFTAVAMQIRWVASQYSSWIFLAVLPSPRPRLFRFYPYGYCCPRRRWRSCCHRGPIDGHPVTWHSKWARRWVGGNESTYLLWPMKCGKWERTGGTEGRGALWWCKGKKKYPTHDVCFYVRGKNTRQYLQTGVLSKVLWLITETVVSNTSAGQRVHKFQINNHPTCVLFSLVETCVVLGCACTYIKKSIKRSLCKTWKPNMCGIRSLLCFDCVSHSRHHLRIGAPRWAIKGPESPTSPGQYVLQYFVDEGHSHFVCSP